MKVHFEDDAISVAALGNVDAWLADARSETIPPGTTLEKLLAKDREADRLNEMFSGEWVEEVLGRNAAPRLRTSAPEPDSDDEWHVGDEDVDKGLDFLK